MTPPAGWTHALVRAKYPAELRAKLDRHLSSQADIWWDRALRAYVVTPDPTSLGGMSRHRIETELAVLRAVDLDVRWVEGPFAREADPTAGDGRALEQNRGWKTPRLR